MNNTGLRRGTKIPKNDKYEIISELARRRGFFWPSYEIYGGTSGFLVYGSQGSILKRRIEDKFRETFVTPLNIVEIESPIITPAKVFEASGHVKAFREPMISCKKCKKKFRVDHLLQEQVKMTDTETEKLNLEEILANVKKHNIRCPECEGVLEKPKYFMTMFTTTIGPYSDAIGYGRPEAAQGIFVEFKRLYEVARERLPLGAVQIGHALRNEISPRQGPVRLREFTIADIEFFFDPKDPQCLQLKEVEDETLRLLTASQKRRNQKKPIEVTVKEALKEHIQTEWQAYFMVQAKHFMKDLGVPEDKQRFIEKLEWERAHYSSQGYDQEILLDRWGWTEVSGHNYRTDYDLEQHRKHSGVDMQVFKGYDKPILRKRTKIEPILSKIGPAFKKEAQKVTALLLQSNVPEIRDSLDKKGYFKVGSFKILPEHVKFVEEEVEETGRRFTPHVVEPSFGIDRLVYAALEYAYDKRKDRTTLKLPRDLAPTQVAVFPLVTKDGLAEEARSLHQMLVEEDFRVGYDEAGSIGRRYARADEAGTPICVTIDYKTIKNHTVTLRDRDSWKQVRAEEKNLVKSLKSYFKYKKNFKEMGKLIKRPKES